uniref:IBB domain-containing protein n=1 Tax=Ascaris lumbricoides TaxID=6252 RepID=A0A0M3IIB8_ASCLU
MAHRSRRELHRQIDAPNRNRRRRQTQAQAHLHDLADSDELPSSLIAPVGTDEVSKC